jgi:serine/threonine protein kinase
MNVLIGDGEKAVLCDFGLSEVGRNANTRPTGDAVIGSRFWMSPERLGGSMWPEPPSDIYAFGMTAFEVSLLLTFRSIGEVS